MSRRITSTTNVEIDSDGTAATATATCGRYEHQTRRCVERLGEEFDGSIERSVVELQVAKAFERLDRTAVVTNWLPLLVERSARAQLADRRCDRSRVAFAGAAGVDQAA